MRSGVGSDRGQPTSRRRGAKTAGRPKVLEGAQELAQSGHFVCSALVDYCWAMYVADRDQPLHAANAVNWSRRAVLFGRRNLEAAQAKRDAQLEGAFLTMMFEAQSSLLASSRKMIRAAEVAAVANVDISGVPTLEQLVESPPPAPPKTPSKKPQKGTSEKAPGLSLTDNLPRVGPRPHVDLTTRWLPDRLPGLDEDPAFDSTSRSRAPVTPPALRQAPIEEPRPK